MVITSKTTKPIRLPNSFYTIRWQTIAIYFSIFIFVFAFISLSVGNIVSDFLIRERTDSQATYNQQIAVTIAPYVVSNDSKMLYDVCSDAAKQNVGRFIIVSRDKIVLADSFSELNGTRLENQEINEVIDKGMDKSHVFYESKVSGEKTTSVNYACGIYSNGSLVGVCVYVASFQDITDMITEIYVNILTIAVVASIAVFVLCLASSHYITKPLTAFSNAIQDMASGNLDTQIEVHGRTELNQLANSFNVMSKKLQNIDRLRNEFVSNASHELRTPLSSIKILIQNMIYEPEMPAEMRTEFLKDIDDEIDRLNNVIEDLLMLVQTTNQKSLLRLSKVNIAELLSSTMDKLEPIAHRKNVTLHFDDKEDVIMNCDKIKLQICFSNLIDNAIKYNNDGGNVHVSCKTVGSNLEVKVRDDGIGIPAHDLPNIFDRFYRVDKTRSRSTGGTGLGLSITQRVILLHGGTITTESHLGEGTEFTVTIPISD